MNNYTQSVLKWALVAGIVVVLNLFFNYAISLIYDTPKWEDFCKQEQVQTIPQNKEQCVAEGGQWIEDPGRAMDKPLPAGSTVTGSCNTYYQCQKEFDEVHKVYNRNVFIVLVILGVLSIVGGFLLSTTPAVSLGLTLGGVLSFIIGSIRYWSDMDDYIRVIILGLALIVLIWLGIKKIKE